MDGYALAAAVGQSLELGGVGWIGVAAWRSARRYRAMLETAERYHHARASDEVSARKEYLRTLHVLGGRPPGPADAAEPTGARAGLLIAADQVRQWRGGGILIAVGLLVSALGSWAAAF